MLIFSLIFGVLAWASAISAVKIKQQTLPVIISFLCCCISAVLQFFDIRNRALDGDLAGLMDTIDITIIGTAVMMLITILLNFIALKIRDKHK